MTAKVSRRRALFLSSAMAASAAIAWAAKPTQRLADERPPIKLETLFPLSAGEWHVDQRAVAFVRPENEKGKLYGIYDQVLERVYVGPGGRRVMLSAVYGAEQSMRLQVHRPEGCYPWAGFKIDALQRTQLALAQRSIPVTLLHAEKPGRSEPITYWTVLGDDVVENDGRTFQWRQLTFGVRGKILDGMLIRVSSIDDDVQRAWALHAEFADVLVKAMPPDQRVRIAGLPLVKG